MLTARISAAVSEAMRADVTGDVMSPARSDRGPGWPAEVYLRARRLVPTHYIQRDQPPGVPPLELTGERTLPDVAEENYWYRRHLVVYEWIAARVRGLRVVDMACGEGYGADVLAGAGAKS